MVTVEGVVGTSVGVDVVGPGEVGTLPPPPEGAVVPDELPPPHCAIASIKIIIPMANKTDV